MALTTAQLATLKTAIDNNPTWAAFPNNSDGAFDLAILLKGDASPVVKAWRLIPAAQATRAFDPAELDNLFQNGGSKGYAINFSLQWLGGIDCSATSGPRAITDLVTQAAAPNSRLALLSTATENMSVGQQIYGGNVIASAAPPAAVSATLRNFTGVITADEVTRARALP